MNYRELAPGALFRLPKGSTWYVKLDAQKALLQLRHCQNMWNLYPQPDGTLGKKPYFFEVPHSPASISQGRTWKPDKPFAVSLHSGKLWGFEESQEVRIPTGPHNRYSDGRKVTLVDQVLTVMYPKTNWRRKQAWKHLEGCRPVEAGLLPLEYRKAHTPDFWVWRALLAPPKTHYMQVLLESLDDDSF